MNEFLYNNAGFMIKCLELSAGITGIIYYNKYKNTNVKYFIFFLCYVFILELIGGYTVYAHKYEFLADFKAYIQGNWLRRNNWFYCIFWTIGSAIFYSFYFRKNLKNKIYKQFLKILTVCFIVYSVISISYNWEAFFVTRIGGINIFSTIVTTFSISLFLLEVLKSNTILIFYKTLNVYICIAVLLWTIVTAPLSLFSNYFNIYDWSFVYLRTNIVLFSNVFLYFTFIIGLIISNPQPKK